MNSDSKLNNNIIINNTNNYEQVAESDAMLQTPYTNKMEKRYNESEIQISAEKEADTTIKKRSFVKRNYNGSNLYQQNNNGYDD